MEFSIYLKFKVEQRKAEATTTTSVLNQPQQQNPNPPPFNPTKQRYPVNYSSDESDDINDGEGFNKQQKIQNGKNVELVVGGRPEQQQGSSVNWYYFYSF